jgi:hypothetical protein
MARFVHIADTRNVRSIRRAGIKAFPVNAAIPAGVYAMPVIPNFYVSHQWVRELKRGGARQMCGVYLHLPDTQAVWVGHYNQPHQWMTAAQASALLMRHPDPQGYEVIIPSAIPAAAIIKIRDLPHIGWRYFPNAHAHKPCGCPGCQARGEIKSRRIRERYDDA